MKHNLLKSQLGLTAPIVQGPFGGGLSSVALTQAVSDLGGLGSFGVHHLSSEGILDTAKAIRAKTNKPFALNLWIPFEDSELVASSNNSFAKHLERLLPYFKELGVEPPMAPQRFAPDFDEQIQAIIEARPAVFSFVYGVPSAGIIEQCRSKGIITLGAATTVEEAKLLETAGIDWIVASGFEAGGHRVSFMDTAERSLTGTFALVPQIVDAVRIPVIAAGGIADARGAKAAMALGASGIQVGTAFLACQESAASDLHKQKLFNANAHNTELTRAFSGRLARGIRNRFVDELRGNEVAPYPLQNWIVGQLKQHALKQGRDDLVSLWAGQGVGLLKHHHAAAVFNELLDGILHEDY